MVSTSRAAEEWIDCRAMSILFRAAAQRDAPRLDQQVQAGRRHVDTTTNDRLAIDGDGRTQGSAPAEDLREQAVADRKRVDGYEDRGVELRGEMGHEDAQRFDRARGSADHNDIAWLRHGFTLGAGRLAIQPRQLRFADSFAIGQAFSSYARFSPASRQRRWRRRARENCRSTRRPRLRQPR